MHDYSCTNVDKNIEIKMELEHDSKIIKVLFQITNSGMFTSTVEGKNNGVSVTETRNLLKELSVYFLKLLKSTS